MAEKQSSSTKGGKRPGAGRKKGVPNRTTTALKDAILKAAEAVGEDGEGKRGLEGYLRTVAKTDIKAFASLLGKVLPLQLATDPDAPLRFEVIERRIVKPGH